MTARSCPDLTRLQLAFFQVSLLFLFLSAVAPFSAESTNQNPAAGINASFLKENLNVNEFVERFEKEGREVFDHRAEIIKRAQIKPGSWVADIGAGTGLFVPLLAEAAGPNGKVFAVDIAKDFLVHIEKRVAAAGLRNVQTVLATEKSVELPTGSIDVAFVCDVYHHFEYPESSLASIYSALRPGGQLILIEFKRIPGESSEWVMKHIRAGQEVFTEEIEKAGFKKIDQQDFLKETYFVRFQKNEKE